MIFVMENQNPIAFSLVKTTSMSEGWNVEKLDTGI